MLVVVVITGVLMAMAVPMFTGYVARKAIDAHISALSSSIRVAKSEALKRSMPVTICPTANPDDPAPTCLATSNAARGWATGWLVFTDWGVRGELNPQTDTVISRQSALANSGGIVPANSSYTLTFFPNGIAVGNQGGSFVFKTQADPENTKLQKVICVSAQGSTRIPKGVSCSSS